MASYGRAVTGTAVMARSANEEKKNQGILSAGWPQVRCVGTHNRVPLTDELQDCQHGFFVQITITRAIHPLVQRSGTANASGLSVLRG